MSTPHPRYWFILGRESLIAAAEIDAVLNLKKYDYSTQILKVDGLSLRGAPLLRGDAAIPRQALPNNGIATVASGDLAMTDPKTLINRLGGTIKIARELANSITEKDLQKIIIDELKTVSGKINFGLSIYSPIVLSPFRGETERGVSRTPNNEYPHPTLPLKGGGTTHANLKEVKTLGLQIKKALKAKGCSVRYVENKEAVLSSVTVEKNGLTNRGREFLIQKNRPVSMDGTGRDSAESTFSIAKTEAVQPFEQFSARDFGRPGRDDLSGMLPPKLAMIMINLAQTPLNSTLLDPFCGSGTILSEATLLGYNNLIGTDISEKATADSKKNIEWIKQKFSIINSQFSINFQVSNVQNLSHILNHKSIDAIVTEPYLGKPLRGQETKQELLSQAKQLKDLYLQAFQQFHQILKPKGKVIFIIPRFSAKGGSASGGKSANEWITIDCKNEIEKIGFNVLPARFALQSRAGRPFFENQLRLVYSRPNQRVAREIWRFEKSHQ